MAASKSPEWLSEVIKDFSTSNYRIEYDGYFSNHVLHGIVAIVHLGGDEKRTREFAVAYSKYRSLEKPVKDDPSRSNYGMIAEERPNYSDLMEHYKAMVASEGSIGAVIKKEFPWLGKGSVSALFHGLIHLGYGIGCGNESMMLEGLSYLHWAYEPIRYDESNDDVDIQHFGRGTADIVGVFEDLQKNGELVEKISSFSDKNPKQGFLQSRFIGVVNIPDFFLKLANSVKLPEFFDPSNYNMESVQKVATWLVVQVLTVFSKSERPNDFVLLHGVTSSWSLRQIVPYLKPEDAVVAIRNLLALILAAYVVERCSALSRDLLELEKPLDDSVWAEFKKETLAKVADEHVYKLVQVCYDLWKDDHLRGKEYDSLFVTAIRTVLDNDFHYVGESSEGKFSNTFIYE